MCAVSFRFRRQFACGNQAGVVQLFGQDGQVVCPRELAQVCEDVEYPFILHDILFGDS
jgi:hypothetical protein